MAYLALSVRQTVEKHYECKPKCSVDPYPTERERHRYIIIHQYVPSFIRESEGLVVWKESGRRYPHMLSPIHMKIRKTSLTPVERR